MNKEKNERHARILESISTYLQVQKSRISNLAMILDVDDSLLAGQELDGLAGIIGSVQDRLREIAKRYREGE